MNNIVQVQSDCTGCSACQYACLVDAITIGTDKEGFYYPAVDAAKCIDCGKCLKKCHAVAEHNDSAVDFHDSAKYYGYILDEAARRNSSSGGVFTAIANAFPEAVIIGAEYVKEERIVKHTAGELSKLRRSKYVESYVGDASALIKNALSENKTVVFCGTPCQVAGMRKLYPNSDKLILIDFICHGVPSMQFLNAHLDTVAKKAKSEIDDVNFRSKTKGWSAHGILYCFRNGKKKFIECGLNSYLYGFYSNSTLRESCYHCKYPHHSCADLTLADFWGVFQYDPKINDEKGLSLFFVNTARGKEIFQKIENGIFCHALSDEDIAYVFNEHNYAAGSAIRDDFIRRYRQYGYEKAIRKHFAKPYRKAKLRQMVKKIIP